jgi:hypothetical protein
MGNGKCWPPLIKDGFAINVLRGDGLVASIVGLEGDLPQDFV